MHRGEIKVKEKYDIFYNTHPGEVPYSLLRE